MDDVILSEQVGLRSNDEKKLNKFLGEKVVANVRLLLFI
jgi:hypothetical protein